MEPLTLDDVLRCQRLPTMPSVAIEVLDLAQTDDVALDAIALVIEKDQALTAKILRTINASYYGLSQPCPTISRAMAYLGLNAVQALVLEPLGLSATGFWNGRPRGGDQPPA